MSTMFIVIQFHVFVHKPHKFVKLFRYSIAIIFGYETVKRWSVHDEYKDKVMW